MVLVLDQQDLPVCEHSGTNVERESLEETDVQRVESSIVELHLDTSSLRVDLR
jgi:hypothetical protein